MVELPYEKFLFNYSEPITLNIGEGSIEIPGGEYTLDSEGLYWHRIITIKNRKFSKLSQYPYTNIEEIYQVKEI
jgi:hypothetical protein